MQRDFTYGRLAVLRVAGIALSGVAACVAAVRAGIAEPLPEDAVPLLLVVVAGGLVAARARGWEILRIDARSASEVWSLGRSLIKVRGLEIAFTRLDHVIVGVLLGTRELGLYSQARYLASLPNAALSPATNAVGLRVMAEVRDDPRLLGRAYSVLQYGLTRVAMAAGVACFVAPDLAISVSLGPEWLGAADVLRALSLLIVVMPLFELEKVLLVARRSWRGIMPRTSRRSRCSRRAHGRSHGWRVESGRRSLRPRPSSAASGCCELRRRERYRLSGEATCRRSSRARCPSAVGWGGDQRARCSPLPSRRPSLSPSRRLSSWGCCSCSSRSALSLSRGTCSSGCTAKVTHDRRSRAPDPGVT
jgi:hypothetical protein